MSSSTDFLRPYRPVLALSVFLRYRLTGPADVVLLFRIGLDIVAEIVNDASWLPKHLIPLRFD